ncbi:MAG: hypothetical protein J6T60_02780 [Bacteroidales bacterium]|nr:hypothetical protein [Bacteroidales bacterium]
MSILICGVDLGLFGKTDSKCRPLKRYCTLLNINFHTPNSIWDKSLECE